MKVLFKDSEVQRLLDDYQKLVGIRIAVFDTDFNELYSSPKNLSPFCNQIRQNETILKECNYCNEKAFSQAKSQKDTYIYTCHMGLYEAVTPLYDNEQILGYVMIGQVLGTKTKEAQWQLLTKKYKRFMPSLGNAKSQYSDLKQMSQRDMEAVSRIMKACAISIWLQHIINIERSPITDRIKAYIAEHIDDPLTTDVICKALNLSKTTIFNYLKTEYSMSLTGYINHIRLEAAKSAIKKTDKSIASIAMEVGFIDYNYFSRLFKKKYHMTPTQYRNTY